MADRRQPEPSLESVLEDLDRVAQGRGAAVAMTHDNPDPDAMASAAGVGFLLEARHGIPTRLAYGGIIGRAENRELVRLLKLPMIPVSRVDPHRGRRGGPRRHPAPHREPQPPRGPRRRHRHRPPPRAPREPDAGVCFVSQGYGATSSIVTALLRAAGLEPPPALATALFYGVKSDTRALGRESKEPDTEAYNWLFPRSDQALLARIEHPQVPLSYFQAYHTAYERARMQGNVITVDLGEVYMPDIVPEIAERLSSLEGAKWSLALGTFEGEIYASVRSNDKRMNAGKLIRSLTADLGGSAGGHGQMAGARVPFEDAKGATRLRKSVLDRFLEACGVESEKVRAIV